MKLVIDMGGVLMNLDIRTCKEGFQKILGGRLEVLGINDYGEGSALLEEFEKGLIGRKEFVDGLLMHSVPGTTEDDVVKIWNSLLGGIPQSRLELLKKYRREGHSLYLLSNINELHWEKITDDYALGSYFDDLFLSYEERCRKPDEEIYRHVMDRTSSKGSELVFVDDMDINRAAAQSLGWTTFPSLEEMDTRLFG